MKKYNYKRLDGTWEWTNFIDDKQAKELITPHAGMLPATEVIREDGHILYSTSLGFTPLEDIYDIIKGKQLIALAGPATVGKSYAADNLFINHKTTPIASIIKRAAHNFIENNFGEDTKNEFIAEKEKIRPIYNLIGQAYREVNPDFLAHKLKNLTEAVVLDDVAFNHEVSTIRAAGGIVIWLDRVGVELIHNERPNPTPQVCDYIVDLGEF